MPETARLFMLVHAYLDQEIDEAQLQELDEMLRGSDRARNQFAVLLSLHRHLYDQYRVRDVMHQISGPDLSDTFDATKTRAVLSSLLEAEQSAQVDLVHVETKVPADESAVLKKIGPNDAQQDDRGSRVIVIPFWLALGSALAAMLAIAIVIVAFLPDKTAPNPGPGLAGLTPAPQTEPAADEFYATVIDTAHPTGASTGSTYRIGARITGVVQLQDELIELRLQNGVHVVMQGPLTANLRDAQSMHLTAGEVVVDVSDSTGGYTVSTDTAEFRDIGTIFAVSQQTQGRSELFVISGEVEAQRTLLEGPPQVERVYGGQAAIVQAESPQIVVNNYFSRQFSRTARDGRERYRREDVQRAVVAYWRFESEQVAGTPLPHTQGITRNLPAIHDASGHSNHLYLYDEFREPVVSRDRVPAAKIPWTGAANESSIYIPGYLNDCLHDLFVWGAYSNPDEGFDLQKPDWKEWTLEVSFWPEGLDGNQTVIALDGEEKLGGEIHPGFACRLVDGRLIIQAMDQTGIQRQIVSSQTVMPHNWNHVAVVFRNDEMRLLVKTPRTGKYEDAGRTPFSRGLLVPAPRSADGFPQTWVIGRGMRDAHFGDAYAGYIDEVRITKLALNDRDLLFCEPTTPGSQP